MQKEKLTLPAIKKDLITVFNIQTARRGEIYLALILPITVVAVFLTILMESIGIGLLIFAANIYPIICHVREKKELRAKRRAVLKATERGELSISIQKFSHIAQETIYEPWIGRHGSHSTKNCRFFYFEGGLSWRIYNLGMHYHWSKHFYLSTQGLENLATAGSEFFFIRLQEHQEIAYVYPCKLFELDESLTRSFS